MHSHQYKKLQISEKMTRHRGAAPLFIFELSDLKITHLCVPVIFNILSDPNNKFNGKHSIFNIFSDPMLILFYFFKKLVTPLMLILFLKIMVTPCKDFFE